MCDGSNEVPILSSGITRRQLQRFHEDFVIVDIREEKEFGNDQKKKLISGIVNVPMGVILSSGIKGQKKTKGLLCCVFARISHVQEVTMTCLYVYIFNKAWRASEHSKKLFGNKKKICFVCPRGTRADLVTRWYNANTAFDCYTLKGGYSAFDEPFAKDDDWVYVVVLAYGEENPEKVGLALNLVNAGTAKGKTSTLILMANAVWLATKSFRTKNQFKLSDTFKPWEEQFANLFSKHGQLICCTSCLKERKINDDDLIKEAVKMQGPDLLVIKFFLIPKKKKIEMQKKNVLIEGKKKKSKSITHEL
ncbi:hypothetical protein RFI_21584 [Reticulomyxa filosa]|uniref:Rhodanese domain-containing protein n=1 Tax=Reticulomyxa filosa TaxID=46433 RepID=X6MQ51_RETFI|nr:hypothetical protein RFI_21584 [Reticulomyxa filosa]|eukprot:ETO15781.1 hypothetical protein RFI_21584 [Reticulomyxa filosa]